MAKLTIEFDDGILAAALADAIASANNTKAAEPAKEEKKPAAKKPAEKKTPAKKAVESDSLFDDDDDDNDDVSSAATVESVIALAKELGAAVARPVMKDFGISSPAKLADAGLEDDELEDLYTALKEAGGSSKPEAEEVEEEEETEEVEELTLDDVKKALQDFIDAEGKEAAKEILEEFGCKSPRTISKLSDDELAELYDAITG